MKKIFTVCMVLLGVNTFAQLPQIQPAWYVDSQAVNFSHIYLNPDNIQSISVRKAPIGDLTTNGSIYLTLKQPFTSFFTLSDITSKHQPLPPTNMVYIINDSLIKDTAGILIDPTFITQVRVFNMSDVHYIQDKGKKWGMIIIRTKTQLTPPNDKNTIRLRGTTTAAVSTKIPPENQGE